MVVYGGRCRFFLSYVIHICSIELFYADTNSMDLDSSSPAPSGAISEKNSEKDEREHILSLSKLLASAKAVKMSDLLELGLTRPGLQVRFRHIEVEEMLVISEAGLLSHETLGVYDVISRAAIEIYEKMSSRQRAVSIPGWKRLYLILPDKRELVLDDLREIARGVVSSSVFFVSFALQNRCREKKCLALPVFLRFVRNVKLCS